MSARVLQFSAAPSLRQELQQHAPVHDFGADVTPLFIHVEWMRFCDRCESEQIFVAKESCNLGLIGHCQKCGEVRIGRWTRANTDVPLSTDWEDYA